MDICLALGRIGPGAKAAVPALERIENSDDEMLREAASDALREIRRELGRRAR